jgi:hypothetical protein
MLRILSPVDSRSRLPKALETNPTYENFAVRCPACKRWSIFNRASDIGNYELVTNVTFNCQQADCHERFIAGHDWINPPWQMMILDCEDLKIEKHYAYCILNMAQAFEMFFALYLRVEFLYKPLASERPESLDGFNKCSNLLFNRTQNYAYIKMRNVFINLILHAPKYKTLAESETAIAGLSKMTIKPLDESIRNYPDSALSDLLSRLMKCNISNLRNDVVHKMGYRPTLNEVDSAIDESASILHALNRHLKQPSDDMHFYNAIEPRH